MSKDFLRKFFIVFILGVVAPYLTAVVYNRTHVGEVVFTVQNILLTVMLFCALYLVWISSTSFKNSAQSRERLFLVVLLLVALVSVFFAGGLLAVIAVFRNMGF